MPWRIPSVFAAGAIFVYGFQKIGHPPSALDLAAAVLLFVISVAILYSLWILTVSAAF